MSKPESHSRKQSQKAPIEDRQEDILERIERYQKEIIAQRSRCDCDIFEIERNYNRAVTPLIKDRNFLIINVPHFWSRVLLQHPFFSTVFEPGEKDVMRHLVGLEVEDSDENPDHFKIHFVFQQPNPYFENRILTKSFVDDGSTSTDIRWKAKQPFPRTQVHEVWEHDDLGLELKGFFRWFSDPQEQFCDPIADILRSHVWFDPLEFFSDREEKAQGKK